MVTAGVLLDRVQVSDTSTDLEPLLWSQSFFSVKFLLLIDFDSFYQLTDWTKNSI